MPRPTKTPSYRRHRQSGQAIVTVTSGGKRKDILLGRYGSPESKTEYARIVKALETAPQEHVRISRTGEPTIAEVMLAFKRFAERRYASPTGENASELHHYEQLTRLLVDTYVKTNRGLEKLGTMPAGEFGPKLLKAVRQKLVEARTTIRKDGTKITKRYSRMTINRQIGRLKRIFKWATAEELYPASNFQALLTVPGLYRGETEAPEREPVGPVAIEHVEATLIVLPPTLRDMVRLQQFTGMRPGEVRNLRSCDVDRSGSMWIYRPASHKNAWRGKARVIVLGPKAREVLRPWLECITDLDEFIFSPQRCLEERYEMMRKRRKSKVQPSQVCR